MLHYLLLFHLFHSLNYYLFLVLFELHLKVLEYQLQRYRPLDADEHPFTVKVNTETDCEIGALAGEIRHCAGQQVPGKQRTSAKP